MANNKRAAMEMTVGTMVTLVLLIVVLVLGLVLTRTIFSSAKYNIEVIDEKIRGEIDKLFAEDLPLVVYLPNQKADIKQGEEWGIAWAVKNLQTGTTQASLLTYKVFASETAACGISEAAATSYIIIGQSEDQGISLRPGETHYEISRIQIPQNAPLCIMRYRINTQLDGQDYRTGFFDVKIGA